MQLRITIQRQRRHQQLTPSAKATAREGLYVAHCKTRQLPLCMGVDAEALAQLAATGLAGIFAGASTYISVAQHPALMETDALVFQAPFFRRMYFYAARMQGPVAVGSGLSALLVSLLQRQRGPHAGMPRLWLASGCLIGGIVPFTVLKMLALNYKLVDSKRCVHRGQSWMQEMLRRWGKLHAVRAGASVLAFSGMLVAMACGGDRTPAPALKAS